MKMAIILVIVSIFVVGGYSLCFPPTSAQTWYIKPVEEAALRRDAVAAQVRAAAALERIASCLERITKENDHAE